MGRIDILYWKKKALECIISQLGFRAHCMRLSILVGIFFYSLSLIANASPEDREIRKSAAPVSVEKKVEQEVVVEKKATNNDTYDHYCSVCHRDGLAGAPKFNDAKDWKSRLESKTLDELVSSVNKGLNAMPEKGTCYECNEDDLRAAIQYMLPKS